jgi:phage terminase large subunit
MSNIVIPYLPRSQFVPFHDRDERWAVLVVHRRGGKTVSAINDLIKSALTCTLPSPRFAYVAPTFAQAKDVAWSYLLKFTDPIPGRVVATSELHVTMAGDRRVRLYGADNYDRMRGIYLDGCVIDEPADMDPNAWFEVIRPALSDRRGWCVWIGTPKGKDAFYRLYANALNDPEWFTLHLPASRSGIIAPDELESAQKAMRSTTGAYEREYECSFEAPIPGSIYGDILSKMRGNGQVKDFLVDSAYPVFAAWDIGWSDETSVWLFQIAGREVLWLWHTRQKHKTAAQMVKIVTESGIPITGNFLPWDSRATAASVGVSYKSECEKAGLMNVKVMPPTREIWAGINASRDILSRSYFRIPACSQGLEALSAYQSKETVSGGAISAEPLHNWASHDADSFRYACEAISLGMVKTPAARRMAEIVPDALDGSAVDVGYVRERQRDKSRGMALDTFKL